LTLQTNSIDTGINPQAVTVNGTVTYETVLSRTGAYFNNATSPYGNYMSLPFTGGATFTIAFWINLISVPNYTVWSLSASSTGGTPGITCRRFNVQIDIVVSFSDDIVRILTFNQPNNSGWTHIALTVNNVTGVCSVSRNGIFQTSITGNGVVMNTSYLILGKGGNSGMNGYLRNFYVFNTILTQANITELALDRPAKNLVGNSDGQGLAAGFNTIHGVTCDIQGNIYVADTNNYKIRKISPIGSVTTLVNGVSGKNITGLNFDPTGNLFYTDSTGGSLYKLPNVQRLVTNSSIQVPEPVARVFAGSGVAGSTNGLGTTASFNQPYGVYAAPDGFIYVSDYSNHCMRRIDASGNVTTFAGLPGTSGFADGTSAARFSFPEDCVMDTSGNLYVVDTGNHRIRKIDVSGNVTTLSGSGLAGGTN
jgi:hypothetical protein